MADILDPISTVGSVRSSPKDIHLMASILKEIGINDYEPRVLNHMLEFSYRYLTTILDDAYLYSTHAKKKCVDSEDVKLAINLYQERVLATPPARDVILDVAKQRNNIPLPQIKSSAGLRLPPDRHSLTACNYRFKPSSKKSRVHTVSRLNASSLSSNLGGRGSSSVLNVHKSVPTISVLPKGNTNLAPAITKPVVSISRPVPTPIIKFSDGKTVTPISSLSPSTLPITSVPQILMPTVAMSQGAPQLLMPTIGMTSQPMSQILMPSMGATCSASQILMPTVGVTSMSTPQIHMPTVGIMNTEIKLPTEGTGMKRAHEEDDDYDNE